MTASQYYLVLIFYSSFIYNWIATFPISLGSFKLVSNCEKDQILHENCSFGNIFFEQSCWVTLISDPLSPSFTHTHTQRRRDERDESQLDALWCLMQRQLDSVPSVFVSFCTFVCPCACSSFRCARGCVHPNLFCLVCVYVRVCVLADGLNWIMLWNTGCVGF